MVQLEKPPKLKQQDVLKARLQRDQSPDKIELETPETVSEQTPEAVPEQAESPAVGKQTQENSRWEKVASWFKTRAARSREASGHANPRPSDRGHHQQHQTMGTPRVSQGQGRNMALVRCLAMVAATTCFAQPGNALAIQPDSLGLCTAKEWPRDLCRDP